MGLCMRAFHERDETSLRKSLSLARSEVMSSLAAAAQESYQRSYPLLFKLHLLRQIESGFETSRKLAAQFAREMLSNDRDQDRNRANRSDDGDMARNLDQTSSSSSSSIVNFSHTESPIQLLSKEWSGRLDRLQREFQDMELSLTLVC